MGYKITKESYKSKNYVWDAEAEALIGMLAKRLTEIRSKLIFSKICVEIHDKYLKKTEKGKTNSPTAMERIFNKK